MIFKKIAAAITASVMAVTSLASFASAERNYPYTATLGFADSTWEAMDWETSIEITGNGTYTITTDSDIWLENSYSWDDEDEVKANGINVFVIDIKGLGSDLDPTDEGNVEELCTFSDVKVTADGVDIPVDQSKLVWGDLESKGDVRLEIYNAYGETKNDPPINPDDIIDVEEISVTFTLTIAEDESDEPITEPEEPDDPEEPFNPDDLKVGDIFYAYVDFVNGELTGEIDEYPPFGLGYKCTIKPDETIKIGFFFLFPVIDVRPAALFGKTLTIPREINGYTVSEIDDSSYCFYTAGCKKVVINDTVTTIDEFAFADSCFLEEVEFSGNSQLKLIGHQAFRNCRSLKSITIPASVETIANGAFINTNDMDLSGKAYLFNGSIHDYEEAEYNFNDTYSLTTVTFAEGSKLKLIDQWAFQGHQALKSITLPDSLEKIGYGAFIICTSLTEINVPKNVDEIGACAFQTRGWNYESGNLSKITVDENNPNFKSVDGVVFSKDGKTIVAYPVAKSGEYGIPADVSKIAEAAFANCQKLTSVTIPEGVTEIPENAFSYCTALAEAKLPSTLKTIGKWGFEATAMTSIDIPESVTAIDAHAFESSSLKNINGVEGSYAETFANENGYKFNGIPTANSENTFTDDSDDSAADIEVIAKPNVIPEEAIFSVRLEDSLTNDEQIAYNCFFTYNGEEYEPTDKVTVRIPIPVAMRDIADTLKVYHYQDGKYVAMEVTVEDGYLVFETDHFSIYVVTAKELDNEDGSESSTEAPTTSDNDGNPSTGAAAVTMVTVAAVIASAAVMVISKKRK